MCSESPEGRRDLEPGYQSAAQIDAAERQRRLEAARKEITRRFRVICRNLSQDDFALLVEKMAEAQIKDFYKHN